MNRSKLFVLALAISVALCVGTASAAFIPGEYTDNSSTLALYHFNQSSGTTATDDTSVTGRTAHDGTLTGSPTPTWTTGDFGNGLNTKSWCYAGDWTSNAGLEMGALTDNGSCTLEFYFKRDSWAANYGWAGYFFNSSGTMWARAYNTGTNGVISLTYGVKGYDAWHEMSVNLNLGVNEWHHLAFTRSATGTSPNFRTDFSVYLDGTLAATDGWDGLWALGSNLLHLGTDDPIGGTYDEVRFSNVALTQFGVPEPATMSILALGGLMTLIRRK